VQIKQKYLVGVVSILYFSFYWMNANAQPLNPSEINVEKYGNKSFLALPSEDPPSSMTWGAYGDVIESFHGIAAYSNGNRQSDRTYQCTELVHRFIREIWGLPTRLGLGMGDGKDLAKGMADRFGSPQTSALANGQLISLEYFPNGSSPFPPVVGSIVSMHFNSSLKGPGHVAIIRKIEPLSEGKFQAILFDQHGAAQDKINIPIEYDVVDFTRDRDGNWSGEVYSWKYKRFYPTTGWTNVELISS